MLDLYQVSATSSPTPVGILSPGSTVTFQPPVSGGSAVAIGTSTLVTTSTGFPLYGGGAPVAFHLPTTSAPATLFAISSTNSAFGVAFTTSA